MRISRRTKQSNESPTGDADRLQRAEKQLRALRRRVAALEEEVLESRQLNKQVAEMIDVIAEVLLPAEHRDDQRIHELLQKYESSL